MEAIVAWIHIYGIGHADDLPNGSSLALLADIISLQFLLKLITIYVYHGIYL